MSGLVCTTKWMANEPGYECAGSRGQTAVGQTEALKRRRKFGGHEPIAGGPVDVPDPIAAGAGRRDLEQGQGRIGAALQRSGRARLGEQELGEQRDGHAGLRDSPCQYLQQYTGTVGVDKMMSDG